MSVAKCIKCGKNVNLEKKNCRETMHGEYAHVKCPGDNKPVLNDNDKEQYRKLTDRIDYHMKNNSNEFLKKNGTNWRIMTSKIAKLKDDGYSYEDQIYALDETVKRQGGFGGYGHVVNTIVMIIGERDKYNKITSEIKIEKADEVKFKFDLGKNDDYEW